jgi:amidase
MASEAWEMEATEIAALTRTGRMSCREAVESCLARLDAVNPAINAVVRALSDEAMAAADEADARFQRGDRVGPLHGVPVTTKVNTDQAGCPTDNGVVAFKDLVATEDSPVVAHLKRAGAIVIGRTNAPAFSMRWFTENELHGNTLNPWDAGRTAGGSSGGAGAAVVTGIGAISQGNDIGGSVRYPAYVNGVVGLRPTMGRMASYNSTAPAAGRPLGASMFATQGPIARTVADCRLAFEVMSARDNRDSRWTDAPLRGPDPARPIRAAVVSDPDDPEVDAAVDGALRAAGRYFAGRRLRRRRSWVAGHLAGGRALASPECSRRPWRTVAADARIRRRRRQAFDAALARKPAGG